MTVPAPLTTPTPAASTPAPCTCQALQRCLDPQDAGRETKRGRRRSAGEEVIFKGHVSGGGFAEADPSGRSSIVFIRASARPFPPPPPPPPPGGPPGEIRASARPTPPPPPPGGCRPPPPPDHAGGPQAASPARLSEHVEYDEEWNEVHNPPGGFNRWDYM